MRYQPWGKRAGESSGSLDVSSRQRAKASWTKASCAPSSAGSSTRPTTRKMSKALASEGNDRGDTDAGQRRVLTLCQFLGLAAPQGFVDQCAPVEWRYSPNILRH